MVTPHTITRSKSDGIGRSLVVANRFLHQPKKLVYESRALLAEYLQQQSGSLQKFYEPENKTVIDKDEVGRHRRQKGM